MTRYVDEQTSLVYEFSNYVVDPNRRVFSSVVRILAYIYRYVRNLQNSSRTYFTAEIKAFPPGEEFIKRSEKYFFSKATEEIKNFYHGKLDNYTENDGILIFTGRLLPEEVNIVTPMSDAMKDLSVNSFCVPAIYKHSPLAYSIANEVHWDNPVVKHSGNESVHRYVLKKAHIIEGRDVVKRIKKSCHRCRYIAKKTIEVIMGPVSQHNLVIAPAFFATQVDLAGPFKSYSPSNKRATVKIWFAVFCCATTGTTNLKVMDDYSSQAFLLAFIRLSCEVGYPKVLLIDSGSQLTSSCENMKISYQDIKAKIYQGVQVECETAPVGGHNMNGKVERKIKEVKESIERSWNNERLSLMQWETLGSEVANRANDLPLAVGNITADFENLDLLTPNRLKLGRNNERSPVGTMKVTNDASKILKANKKIFQSWFENWLISCVPNLIEQPKWFKTSHHIKPGDVVIFTKSDTFSPTYQFGIVHSTSPSNDGVIRKVSVKYRNASEQTDRFTDRAVRSLVVIHKVDEINIMQDLYDMEQKSSFLARFCY